MKKQTTLYRTTTFVIIFLLLTFSSFAQDRLFTYTYQSTVLNKGQRELEIWNTFRTGKENYYSRLDNRSEFEIGLGKRLQTSFYLNLTSITTTVEENSAKTLQTDHEISFSNEWKYKLLDPVANQIGMALYGEYGIGSSEYELEGKLILDKKISDFTFAGNAVYELEIKPGIVNNETVWEKESKNEYYLALSYSFSPKFHITMENTFKNVFEGSTLNHSALYSGFGIACVQENFWINFTVLPQVASFRGETNSNLNLNEFEKVQLRLLFSYAF